MPVEITERSEGVIKCAYSPRDFFENPQLYSKPESTFEHLDKLVQRVSSALPQAYQQVFRRKAVIRNEKIVAGKNIGEKIREPAMFDNFERWDKQNGSQIFVKTGIGNPILTLPEINYATNKYIYLGVIDIGFTYPNVETVKRVLEAFAKEFLLGTESFTLSPLVQRLKESSEGVEKVDEGKTTLRWIYGKGKKIRVLDIEEACAFRNEITI